MRGAATWAALLALSLSTGVRADPRPMSAGAVPWPGERTEVRIAREVLTIELDRKAAAVKALLTLENKGEATRLQVGFPCDGSPEPGVTGLECRTRIAVLVDGKKQAVKRKGAHFVWPMRFAPGQKVELEVSYRSPLRNERYQEPFRGMMALHYRLVTGAEWAGPIGELSVEVRLPTDALLHVTPAGYTRERGRLRWRLEEYEPKGDLALLFHSRLLGRPDATPEERQAIARELREAKGEVRSWVELFQRLLGEAVVIPPPSDEEVLATLEASAKLYEGAP